MRVAALDVGDARVGVAVCDELGLTVRGAGIVQRVGGQRDLDALAAVLRPLEPERLVVGLPLNMDGSEGAQATDTRAWAAAVAETCGLPVAWCDERLTSVRAEARVGSAGRGRGGGPPSGAARNAHRARIDREAAAAILQAELDARLAAGREA